jgi:NADH-quinone oxidoreductase subunit L
MTFPLQALAIGAIVAGFIGIPMALGGGNTIEHFLEPSFTAEVRLKPDTTEASHATTSEPGSAGRAATSEPGSGSVRLQPDHAATEEHEVEPHASRAVELGLMVFSVLVALVGIFTAQKFYVKSPEISEQLAEQFAGPHRLLSNKYYVDELYDATVISGTFASARGLWTFDRRVVDGLVNGSGWLTRFSAWLSGLTDRTVVDGVVNLVGWIVHESSLAFRRLQTGLVQTYALLMLFGLFAFVSIYLLMR